MPNSETLARQKRAVWMLAAGETLVWASLFYIFAALLLSWEKDLDITKADLAAGFTVALLMAALVSPISGRIVDAGAGRWLLPGGAVLGAVALASLSQAQTSASFILIWAVIGLAQGACLYEPCFALVTRTTGAFARMFITRITLAAGFASFIAFPTGAFLAGAIGWRGTVLVFATAVALIAAPLLFFGAALLERDAVQQPATERRQQDRSALRAAVRRPAFWLLAAGFALLALNHGMLISHIVPLLVEKGLGEVAAVAAASVIGPMQVLGRLMLFVLGQNVKNITVTLFAFAGVILASMWLMASGSSVLLVFAFAATQGASFGLISIIKPAVISDYLGRRAFGSISGWLALPYLAGVAFGPVLGAVLWEIGGYDLAVAVAAVLATVGIGCIILLAWRQSVIAASS